MLPSLFSIETRRRRLGLTQSALAKSAQVSQSLVAKVESASVDPAYSHAKAILDALESLESASKPVARQLMSAKVHAVRPGELVSTAVAFMKRHQISQMPVIESGTAVGSISEKTILDSMSEGTGYSKVAGKKVRDVMDEPFPAVAENTPMPAVAELLKTFPAILVRNKAGFCGIITKADLLRALP